MNKFAIAAAFLLVPTAASAVSVSLHASNSGIGSISVNIVGNVITIDETWTGAGTGALLFTDADSPSSYTIIKNITNNSGTDWNRLANELLDPLGDGDDGLDPLPYPTNVPAGFSTSNDSYGLTFSDPRSASNFPNVFIDESTDARDFVDFFGGTLANGASGTVTYNLFGLSNAGDFILQQRPNASSVVSEPAALGVLGLALLALARGRRRRA